MAALITSEGVKKTILQLRATAKMKADQADDAFLKHADARAVQGGAICEEANAWHALARALTAAAVAASALEDFGA